MAPKLCFVVLDHRADDYFADLVDGLQRYCPGTDLAWYDSGSVSGVPSRDVPRLACSTPRKYAKVAPFFFDMFEWAAGRGYDYVINVESDMAFVQAGFDDFVFRYMTGVDYLAQRFRRHTSPTSRWRPYRSLRGERAELFAILGVTHTNEGFSPGQIFSTRYIETVLASPFYQVLRGFVERNQEPGASFSLQEVLLPTLPDVLDLAASGYPPHMAEFNRYRPYHARRSVERAHATPDTYFVHPVRRDANHPARQLVRALANGRGTMR